MAMAEPLPRETAASERWLSIIGIGEDGVDGWTQTAMRLVAEAEIVFGGKRHLALAAPLIKGAARPWPSPFERAVESCFRLIPNLIADFCNRSLTMA